MKNLVRSGLGSIEGLKEQAVCNFAYLYAFLQAFGLSHLLSVFLHIQQQCMRREFDATMVSVYAA